MWSFAVICEGVEVGNDCVVGSGVYIGKDTKIGNGVRIEDKAHITDHMIIEDNVFIATGVLMVNDKKPIANNPNYTRCNPKLREGCSLGCGAIILPGVEVGKGAMVGAGAVVTKNVEPGDCVIGCPAQPMRRWIK